MNKNELVSAVAEKAGLTKSDAASAVDAVFDVVQAELKNKGDIRLAGFGSFTVSHRAASKGRNPSTGAEVDIPARNVPKFTPGKGLKDAVNGWSEIIHQPETRPAVQDLRGVRLCRTPFALEHDAEKCERFSDDIMLYFLI
jgi:DNA-binding protein HU-beta